jgi:hypothetical protein
MYEEVLVRDMHRLHMIKLENKLTTSEKHKLHMIKLENKLTISEKGQHYIKTSKDTYSTFCTFIIC